MKIKIGDYRLLKAGTPVWLIAVQETVRFEKDVIVEVAHTVPDDAKSFEGKLKMLLYNIPGCVPGLVDKANGDVGSVPIDKTEPYEVPEPQFIEFKYKDD